MKYLYFLPQMLAYIKSCRVQISGKSWPGGQEQYHAKLCTLL